MTLEELPTNPMQPYIDVVRDQTGVEGTICVSIMAHHGHPSIGAWDHWSIHIGDAGTVHTIGRSFSEALGNVCSQIRRDKAQREVDPIALGM